MSEFPLILVLLLGWRGPRPRHLVDMTTLEDHQRCRRAVAAMRLAMEAMMTRGASATVDGAPDCVLLGEQALAQLKRAETLRLLAK